MREEEKVQRAGIRQNLHIILLVLFCLLTLLPGLGRQVMERQQELRVALTARDMVETGDWMVPHFEGHPRLQKPPLMYWVVAGAYRLCHTTRSAFVARAPTVLFASLLILAVYILGVLFFDRKVAFLGALMASSSFLFQRFARLAETDMLLALFTTLSVASCYYALKRDRSGRWWLAAGVFSGLGFMTKGPAALVIPFLAVLVFVLVTPSFRSKVLAWKWTLFLLSFAVVALPWYLLISMLPSSRSATAVAVGSEMYRLVIPHSGGHPGAWYYYLYKLPLALLPLGGLLPFAVWDLWRNERRETGPRFLLSWFVSSLILLSVLHNKQEHYALLLLSASSLVLARFVAHGVLSRTSWSSRIIWSYMLLLLGILTVATIGLLISPAFHWWFSVVGALATGLPLVALVFVGWRAWWRRSLKIMLMILLSIIVIFTQGYIFIGHMHHRPETLIPEFIQRAAPYMKSAPVLYHIGQKKAAAEFYSGREILSTVDPGKVWRTCPDGSVVMAVENRRKRMLDLSGLPETALLDLEHGTLRCRLYRKQKDEPTAADLTKSAFVAPPSDGPQEGKVPPRTEH